MSELIVLDTNVLSEVFREVPDPKVAAWYLGQRSQALITTSITLSEALYGIGLMPRGTRRDRYQKLTTRFFEEEMAGRILPFDEAAAHFCAELRGKAAQRVDHVSSGRSDCSCSASRRRRTRHS